jgi:hypothetical protein
MHVFGGLGPQITNPQIINSQITKRLSMQIPNRKVPHLRKVRESSK